MRSILPHRLCDYNCYIKIATSVATTAAY